MLYKFNTQSATKFSLWEGEMLVTVMADMGAHGFVDALMIIQRCDDPFEVRQYNANYENHFRDPAGVEAWVDAQLTKLATPGVIENPLHPWYHTKMGPSAMSAIEIVAR